MKKLSLSFFLCFCLYFVNGQNADSNDIVIGKIETIDSKILNEQRKIWVHIPEGNSGGIFEKKNYPVVYVLDGDSHFYSVVGMIQQLSSVNGNTICPQMIVVGIPNTDRTRDLTPTKVEADPFISSSMAASSGGGDNFMEFIEKELIPYIDSNYPTNPYRMFIGHSFGGLTVMNTLFHKPNLFNSYVSIDPSMWWDNKKLLNNIKNSALDEKYKSKTLFLGIANTMDKEMDTIRVKKDTTISTRHMRAILELNSSLNKKTQKQLSYKGKYYEDDDHGSVPLIAEYDALHFIFDFYQLKLESDDYMNPESDISDKVENHYKRLSKAFGLEMKPDEEFVNGLGYQFMNMAQFKKAERCFEMNVKNYPNSFNVYDSIGDLYVAIENKEKAIENYKKSISLNSESFSIDKLKELEKE